VCGESAVCHTNHAHDDAAGATNKHVRSVPPPTTWSGTFAAPSSGPTLTLEALRQVAADLEPGRAAIADANCRLFAFVCRRAVAWGIPWLDAADRVVSSVPVADAKEMREALTQACEWARHSRAGAR
jgi:hypothetical protein